MAKSQLGMKVAQITTVPESLAFISGQTRYIQNRGFVVHAITSPGEMVEAFRQRECAEATTVEITRSISPLRDLFSLSEIIRILRTLRPAVVHAHTPKGGLLGMIASWLVRTPVRIYHIRGLPYMTAHGERRRLLQFTERISCRLASRVFCVSHSMREVAIADGLCSGDKIVVFGGGSGNGVDSDQRFNPQTIDQEKPRVKRQDFGIPDRSPVVLFVGRIVRDKGVEELARAWSDIRMHFPDAYLVLAGPSELQDPVSDETMISLIQDPHVVMTGRVEDIVPYYALADLVVLPTYREGFPNVPLEAAAMELPVVATQIPGCTDAVEDGVTGTLVPPRDAESLCCAIKEYLEHPAVRRKHGLAGRKRVLRDFRQEVIWEAIYQEYCRLLEERGLEVPKVSPEAPLDPVA